MNAANYFINSQFKSSMSFSKLLMSKRYRKKGATFHDYRHYHYTTAGVEKTGAEMAKNGDHDTEHFSGN